MKAFQIKAYQVDGYDDSGSVIVFAKHSVIARRKGANELGIDFESVDSCSRRPGWDKYAEQGWVPVEDLVNSGWWFECTGCYARVTDESLAAPRNDDEAADFEEEYGRPWAMPVFTGRDVWCCQGCMDDWNHKRWLEKRAIAALPRYLRRKFPGAILVTGHASYWRKSDRNAYIHFSFPGSKGTADLTVRACESDVRNGREKGRVMVPRQDLKAWYEWRGTPELFNESEAA